MTSMDHPAENATVSKCNERLDTVVVAGSAEEELLSAFESQSQSLPSTSPLLPLRSCLTQRSDNAKSRSSSSSSSSSSSKKGKAVNFVEFISVTECLHYLDYSKQEFRGTWFTPEEMTQSRDEYRQVLANAGSLAAHLNDELCLRGLEHKTPMGDKRREQNLRLAWLAVEREQYRQWDQGFKDEQALADECQMATLHCVQKAIMMAKEDRQAVLAQPKYYEMDGLTVGSLTLSAEKSTASSSAHSNKSSHNSSFSSSAAASSPLFAATKHHPAIVAVGGGRRPTRSQGRASRGA